MGTKLNGEWKEKIAKGEYLQNFPIKKERGEERSNDGKFPFFHKRI